MEKFHKFIDTKSSAQKTTFSLVVIGLIAVVSVLDSLLSLPRPIQVVLALPLAAAALAVVLGLAHRHMVKNKGVSLRTKLSPVQRLRFGLGGYVILMVILFGSNGTLPTTLGAIIALTGGLSIYHFIRRSREELEMAEAGILDPRDEKLLKLNEPEEEEVDEDKVAEYAEFINSLPEEQRKLILDPKLNNAITVGEDDSKKKKKKSIFRR